MNVAMLLEHVRAIGYAVELTEHGPRLVQVEPGSRVPSDLLSALKTYRTEIIEHLSAPREPSDPEGDIRPVTCSTCGKDATDPETRARLADPVFCSTGRTSQPPCPFKPKRWD